MLPRDIDAIVVLVRGDVELASWPLRGRGRPYLDMVDELARLQLAARRLGCSIELRDACVDLSDLVDLVGLGEILTGVVKDAGLRPEVAGEAEGGEQARLQEVVMPDDPVA